ncbi:hypothetical protein Goklo_013999 [Gossypium klotzschianum]|uniref:Uncharacterized protein n=1 Tax=Gossypium klotzschianum TaxID=34286 RepID=A0A7J8U660_9ROSI|nr:hypothetical protein [Gossypium klotzschianum]
MERTNSRRPNSRGFLNLTVSASTAPKAGRHKRKRKMKTVVSSEAEASIGV